MVKLRGSISEARDETLILIPKNNRIDAIRRSGLLDRAGSEQFGHLTEHVRTSLEVPVAIISIVDRHRQVFAGHCGLPEPWASQGETPLTHSFCQHVVEDNAPLVVRNANAHELVMDNHAIGDLGVVAYLGVPISLPTGELVGALAAIDTKPRDWTERDRRSLESLAKVVEKEIAVGISELKYRSLFADMHEGYYVATAIRNQQGELTDVLFEDVNPAFTELTGLPYERVVGSTLTVLFPDVVQEMIPAYDRVLKSGESFLHSNSATVLGGRWFENRIRRLDSERIASIFTDITDRKTAEIRLSESEAHWRGLFEQLEEGFILGELIRDDRGNAVDWRYKEVNRAWGELVGVPSETALGRTIREVFPGIEDEWVMEFADVVDSGTAKVFTRQVGSLDRWYEGHVQALDDERFVVMFVEVTERLRMENELRDREQQLRTVLDSMPVGVVLASAPSGRIVMQNQRLRQIIGQDATDVGSKDQYDVFVAEHRDGTAVRPEEYPLSKILAGECLSNRMEVRFKKPDGDWVWVAIVGEAIHDNAGKLSGAVIVVSDIADQKKQEEQQRIINREMSHRLKNMLAMVQAIASQTLRPVSDRSYVEAFDNRLRALSSAQDVLLLDNRDEAPISQIIDATLNRLVPTERLAVRGPEITIGPKGTLSLALMLHELATNALKYGSLSVDVGRVSIDWCVKTVEDEPSVIFSWQESGGPPVREPDRRGFGSKLIRMGLIGTGGVDITYAPTGFRAEMTAPLHQLQHAE